MPRDGTLSTHVLVQPCLYPKPSQWSFEQAAALPLAGLTAWRALVTQAKLQKGDTVWILGIGGGVAQWALQWAISLGACVWVTSSSQEKLERATSQGAKGGILYGTPTWAQNLQDQSGPPQIILDGGARPPYPHGCHCSGRPLDSIRCHGGPSKTYQFVQIILETSDVARIYHGISQRI